MKCFPFSPAATVRKFFPNADDKQVDYLLWNHTGWPCFWRTGAERDIKHSLRHLRRTLDAGKKPCDLCNDAADSPYDERLCRWCSRAMARPRRE